MLTRIRFHRPAPTGDPTVDVENLSKAISDYFLLLEKKGSLQIDEAQIRAAQGIKFPTSQGAASTDANTLDDYAEVTAQSITVTSGTGTLTTVSGTIDYTKIGREVKWKASITITTNGTGATDIRFTFPFTVQGIQPFSGFDTARGVGLIGYINGTTALFYDFDTTYPGVDGSVCNVWGVARV